MEIINMVGNFISDIFSVGTEFFMSIGESVTEFVTNKDINEDFSTFEKITSIGMSLLVIYAVGKMVLNLIWKLLFGREFSWSIGILERLTRLLPSKKAERYMEGAEGIVQEAVETATVRVRAAVNGVYAKSIDRKRSKIKKGGKSMVSLFKNLFAKFNINKYTNMATGAVIVMLLTVADYVLIKYFEIFNFSVLEFVLQGNVGHFEALIGEAIVAAPFVLKAIRGVGIETPEEYKERLSKKAAEKGQLTKEDKKILKEEGKLKKELEKTAKRYLAEAKKFGGDPIKIALNKGATKEVLAALENVIGKILK